MLYAGLLLTVLLLSATENKPVPTYLERTHEGLVYAHHGSRVVKLPTVVWGREQGHQLSLRKELVSILDNLHRGTDVNIN